MPVTTPPDADLIAQNLPDGTRWDPILVVASTASTNLDVAAAAVDGAEPGMVIVSDHQEAGRGRFTRAWEDMPGTSVAFSALVRPKRPQSEWGWLNLIAGLAVSAAICELSEDAADRVKIKWPNDVLVDERKICGILSESDGTNVVIGIGINTSMDDSELPVPTATSLLLAGLPTDKSRLVARVLTNLDRFLTRWEIDGNLSDDYLAWSGTIGRRVRVLISADESVEGLALGVGVNGELIVDCGGKSVSFTAGDVVHLRVAD